MCVSRALTHAPALRSTYITIHDMQPSAKSSLATPSSTRPKDSSAPHARKAGSDFHGPSRAPRARQGTIRPRMCTSSHAHTSRSRRTRFPHALRHECRAPRGGGVRRCMSGPGQRCQRNKWRQWQGPWKPLPALRACGAAESFGRVLEGDARDDFAEGCMPCIVMYVERRAGA